MAAAEQEMRARLTSLCLDPLGQQAEIQLNSEYIHINKQTNTFNCITLHNHKPYYTKQLQFNQLVDFFLFIK
jgi:hypothetical protein